MTEQAGRRALWWAALAFGALAAAGLLGLDPLVARWAAALPEGGAWWDRVIDLLDLVTLHILSNFLLGALLIVVAGALLALPRTRKAGWPLLYVGLVQFVTTTLADLSKPQFGRLRPYEAGGGDAWFVGANSFPSGHAAFYAGLFLPLVPLFPRWALLSAIPPLFVAAARIMGHDHYLSDVAASLALAAALAAGLAFIARKG